MKSKNNDIKEITRIFNDRLEKSGKRSPTTFNLSTEDMQDVTNLINKIDKSIEKKLFDLTKTFGKTADELEKVQISLESVPKDDDVGPIISEIQNENRELGRLESEFKNLEELEMQEKSLLGILNSKILNLVKDKHQDKRRISGMENAKRVQQVLDEYSKRLRDKKLELLERYIT